MHENLEPIDRQDQQAADQMIMELVAAGLDPQLWRINHEYLALLVTPKEAFDLSHPVVDDRTGRRKFRFGEQNLPLGLLKSHLEEHPRTRRGETRVEALTEAKRAYYGDSAEASA